MRLRLLVENCKFTDLQLGPGADPSIDAQLEVLYRRNVDIDQATSYDWTPGMVTYTSCSHPGRGPLDERFGDGRHACPLKGAKNAPSAATGSSQTGDRLSTSEVEDAFEAPLSFLMTPQHYERAGRDWNGLTLSLYTISFGDAPSGARPRAYFGTCTNECIENDGASTAQNTKTSGPPLSRQGNL